MRGYFAGAAILCCLLSAEAASAATTTGGAALALAALAAVKSPAVGALDRLVLLAYLEGRADAPLARGRTISVKADAIDCRASNIDITSHSCDLAFGAKKATLSGRKAHELYATLIENGVALDGAAGTMHAAVTALDCTIKIDEIRDKAGGGANCSFSQ